MGTHHILEALDGFIRKELLANQRQEPVRSNEEILKTGIVDSIGFFRLLAFIEERFGVKHGDEELVPDNFRTLAVIAKRIQDKLKAQPINGA